MFLEINIPFLSTISLLIKENFDFCFSILNISLLFIDIWVILIEKTKIKEIKKKNKR